MAIKVVKKLLGDLKYFWSFIFIVYFHKFILFSNVERRVQIVKKDKKEKDKMRQES